MRIGGGVSTTLMSVLSVSPMGVLTIAVVGFDDLEYLGKTEIANG